MLPSAIAAHGLQAISRRDVKLIQAHGDVQQSQFVNCPLEKRSRDNSAGRLGGNAIVKVSRTTVRELPKAASRFTFRHSGVRQRKERRSRMPANAREVIELQAAVITERGEPPAPWDVASCVAVTLAIRIPR